VRRGYWDRARGEKSRGATEALIKDQRGSLTIIPLRWLIPQIHWRVVPEAVIIIIICVGGGVW